MYSTIFTEILQIAYISKADAVIKETTIYISANKDKTYSIYNQINPHAPPQGYGKP